jgi:rod shape-determining protein MreD
MKLSRSAADDQLSRLPGGREIVRLIVVLLIAFLLQTTVAPNLRVMGANPDFALIIVVSVGLVLGAEVGAVFGFLAGSLVAMALIQPLGLSAFVFVLVGYLAGRYAETADLSAGFAPLVAVFTATLVADVLLAIAQSLIDRQVPMGFFAARVLVPSLVLNTLLAAPLYLAVRVALRGAGDLRVARAR